MKMPMYRIRAYTKTADKKSPVLEHTHITSNWMERVARLVSSGYEYANPGSNMLHGHYFTVEVAMVNWMEDWKTIDLLGRE